MKTNSPFKPTNMQFRSPESNNQQTNIFNQIS